MALPNYVKFQRGSQAAYNRLSTKDENTLYFIYDASDNSKGTLYLGSRLIGNVGGSTGVNSLSELSDVLVSAAQTGDFLVLNSEGQWTATSVSDVVQTILESGSNFVQIDENEFRFNTINGNLELRGYSDAAIGMIPVKSNLGLSWQQAPVDVSSRVSNLESRLSTAQSDISALQTSFDSVDGKIATAVNNSNHLKYQVINNLSEATEERVIYLYNNDPSSANDKYNEYMLVNGNLELIGSTAVDLSNYLTKNDQIITNLNSKVNNLESSLSDAETAIDNLETTVDDLGSTLNDLSGAFSILSNSVSNLSSNLNNYVLTTTFNSVVGDLTNVNSVFNDLSSNVSIAETLEDIYERLTWKELSE